jgi:hypothetical protein
MSKASRDLHRTTREQADAFNLPVGALVSMVLPELDALKVEQFSHPGTFTVPIRHPYLGITSWIRVQPEPGTQVLVQQRGDLAQAEVQGYVAQNQALRVARGQEGTALYRQLATGEIELMSGGRAYLHLGRDGSVALLGGQTQQCWSQAELEIVTTAPTHVRRLHLATPQAQQYLERFGYVKRPDQTKTAAIQRYIKQQDQSFSVEYSRWLATKAGTPLTQVQEGHCIDETGAVLQSQAGNPLRYLRVLTDSTGNETFRVEIDDALNYSIVNSSTTAVTFEQTAGSQGTCKASGKTWNADYTGTTGTFKAGTKAVVQAPQVELGQGALVAVVLSPTLMNSVLTPVLSALTSLCTSMASEATVIPASAAAATAAITTIAMALAQVQNIASQTVKASL